MGAVLKLADIKPKTKKLGNGEGNETGKAYGLHITKKDLIQLAERFDNPTNESGFRNNALFLCLMAAPRLAEVLQFDFRKSFVSDNGNTVMKVKLKGGRQGHYVLNDKAVKAIKDYLTFIGQDTNGHCFFAMLKNNQKERKHLSKNGLLYIVKQWAIKKANGSEARCHSFRHSASLLLADKQDGNVFESSRLLNHKNLNTTLKYYSRPFTEKGTDLLS